MPIPEYPTTLSATFHFKQMQYRAEQPAEQGERPYYQTRAGALEYQGKHHPGFHDRQIAKLRSLVPGHFPQEDLRLLEIGSGHAPDYPSLVGAGFQYTGMDSSQEMLDRARAVYGSAPKLFQQDMRKLDFPPRSFHAVWAAAALHHVSRDELGGVLQRIRQLLIPGGVAYFSVRGGDDNDRTNAKTGITYVHHSAPSFNEALEAASFRVEAIGTNTIDNPVPGDGSASDIAYTFSYVRNCLESLQRCL